MSLTYTTYVTSLANLLVVPESDSGFQTVLPNIIDDAELRIYRDLDLLDTVNFPGNGVFDLSTRYQTVPNINIVNSAPYNATDQFPVVVKTINVITPSGSSQVAGTLNQLVPASIEMLNTLWPSAVGSTVPQYFAMAGQNFFVVGPWPDTAYGFVVEATYRYDSLSATNQTTIFSLRWPDMLIAASMVFAAGYQKNFGAAVDDPKMAVTWESHYQVLLNSAKVEEDRKRLTEHGIPETIPPSPIPRV